MNFPSVANFSVAKGNTGIPYNTFNVPTTVVNSAYDTSGNGGRKLVQLNDGTLIAAMKNTSTLYWYLYSSSDSGKTWTNIYNANVSTALTDISIATNGTYIYVLVTFQNANAWVYSFNKSGTILGNTWTTESSQSAVGNCSIAYSASDNTLHAVWSSKNSSYPSSFNNRYAKGTINADGSASWGAIDQVTVGNSSGYDTVNPTITVDSNGIPCIICESSWVYTTTSSTLTGSHSILFLKRDLNASGLVSVSNTWKGITIYQPSGYAQASPSVIFVPQSVNGLANGRLWGFWHGEDSTYSSHYNIRYSYSDDGGSTWSSMQLVTTDNSNHHEYVSVTASKRNEIHIVWAVMNANQYTYVNRGKLVGSTWTISQVNTNTGTAGYSYPSALYDPSIDFTQPMFIFLDLPAGAIKYDSASTIQQFPTPPEIYIPLWWYSGSNINTNTTNQGSLGIIKGSSGTAAGNFSASSAKLHMLNPSWNPAQKYALEIAIYSNGGGTAAMAALYDITSSTTISASQVTTTTTTMTVLRSAQFTLTPGHTYGVTIWSAGSYVEVTDASLIVFPS